MDCQEAVERLPWLLNGTLENAEAEAVRAHLARCAACRQELEETRRAAVVFGAHLPTESLVDLAWDRPPAGLDPGLLRRHLESCQECAEELALVRESRRREAEPAKRTAPPAGVGWVLALAAGLTIAFVTGLWWAGPRDGGLAPTDPRAETLSARVASLESETRRLREAAAALEAQLGSLRAPQLNLPVFELLPARLTRSAQAARNVLVVPPGAAFVALVLSAEQTSEQPAAFEIKDERGAVVWSGQGLRPSPLGGYTLAVPAPLLPPGDYTFTVSTVGGRPATYAVRVRRP